MLISQLPSADATIIGDPDLEVTGVSHDSRTVAAGQLYAALPGGNVHGASFAVDVVGKGVRAILTDSRGWDIISETVPAQVVQNLTGIIVENPRAVLGGISAEVYGTGDEPQLLGVTGTNGKTTTTYLIAGMLEALGQRTGVIGTVATLIDGVAVPSVRTTPEAPELHALFARMRERSVDTCAMEVSSHALSQHRVDGAHFRVSGFTNLSQDHLDFHRTMDAYFAAKALLFTPEFSEKAVIVIEDEWGQAMVEAASVPARTLGRDDRSEWRIEDTPGQSEFTLHAGETKVALRSPLPGDFNITNTALAAAMLLESGVDPDRLTSIGRTFEVHVPGRMEVVRESDPRVIVDYSHTPDAIAKALSALTVDGGHLHIVFGAGGDRDPGKRFGMGQSAARLADVIVLTDDNPRTEDPDTIRAEIREGITAAIDSGTARVDSILEIADRGEAIDQAVTLAGPGDTVLVAGKGHETGQEVAGVVTHFDDRERTRTALDARRGDAETGKVHS